ncbi:hypothetical protein H1P_1570015 [Hyella patelloides LEGE 07179]|uniref:Uncharacterized protein n=1 Tax=Hyella patelloides LEGE 07179 TaxID=945734 RepID=A0A563VMF1_9CYAN|nr:hypothetical protein H1P_1570015 [Hyella patelloides LEGE 07179]
MALPVILNVSVTNVTFNVKIYIDKLVFSDRQKVDLLLHVS